MNRIAVLLLAFVASLAAQTTNYSGIWKGTGGIEDAKYGSVPQTAQLTLLQAGTSLTGTLKIGNGQVMKISSGSVSGNQITFAIGTGGTASLTPNGALLQGKLTSSQGKIFDVVFRKE